MVSVNVCVIGLFVRSRRSGTPLGVLGYVVVPAIGVVIDLYLLFNLSGVAKLLGLCWLALGVVYLLVLTRGLRRPPPEIDTLAAESEADERAQAS
jgi:putrescine importer